MRSPTDKLDYREVDLIAYELGYFHGARAFHFASKRKRQTLDTQEPDEHLFWTAVALRLQPR
ncbi:MAG: hypothetical protein A2885_05810 [Sphingopyxis sp. RIFCSPHIGHO2_01_FULL_65_24]|nr:MAG: hypothetical protein A2885_05810 [Sphingopyxis sp. RIFCSPHIGHO2_01_FULL_65_24]